MPTVRLDYRIRHLAAAGAVLSAFAATVVALPTQTPAMAGAASPATPTGLPAAIEGLAPAVAAKACDPRAKPGTVALGSLLVRTYPGTSFGISRTCGTTPTSEHNEGRAIDWMASVRNPTRAAQAAALLRWLHARDARGNYYANARRLGVMYIIWNNRMWRAYNPSAGWREYNGCLSKPAQSADTTCHRDHVHISLSWEGAMRRTSFWTKRVAAPDYGPCRPRDLNWAMIYTSPNPYRCASYPRVGAPAGSSTLMRNVVTYSGQYLRPGSSGTAVKVVQQAVRSQVTGTYGSVTATAVARFQRTYKLPVSGIVTPATWRTLIRVYWPRTTVTVNPLTQYKYLVLRYGSRGPAVAALQRALRISPVTGWFGPVTHNTVVAFQRRVGIPATGVVEARTWRALGA